MEKPLARYRMVGVLVARFIYHIHKAGHFDPKVFETKGLWLFGPLLFARRSRQWSNNKDEMA
jgi:hypothetical protein